MVGPIALRQADVCKLKREEATIDGPVSCQHSGQGVAELVPVREIQVKSEIARPMPREVVPAGSGYRVFGAAWAGESMVTKVEISTDNGKSWQEATLRDKSAAFTWRRWEYSWLVPEKTGRRVLLARATDARGRMQPMKRDEDRRDAVISHVLPIEVEIR